MMIHIFGASGSGVTTLGNALSAQLSYRYFDTDEYFWKKTNPPFTLKRDPELRNQLLLQHLSPVKDAILGGSLVSWGLPLVVDLSVFLYVPHGVRMERLKKREYERYGDIIFTDPERNKKYNDFISWAAGYDDNTTQSPGGRGMGRTLLVHQNWINNLSGPFLEITGDTTVNERVYRITQVLKTLA